MREGIWHAGGRTPFRSGDSVAVSLPKAELRRQGIDVEDLTGAVLHTRGEGNEFTVELPSADETDD